MTERAPASPRGIRRVLFYFAAVVGVPALVLVAIEGSLRLVGYGYETSFLVEREIGGQAFFTNNPRFGWRFFPRTVARPGRPLCFPREKPAGAYRIFVVGGSAALGDPQPDFGMARYLQAMLEVRRPDVRFEVINAGMTAINSHVVLPIVRDCARADPDLIVVYLGNNELVGPFGASSVFGVPGAGLPVARANVWAKSTRLGQLIEGVLDAVRTARRRGETPEKWQGMEFFLGNQVARDDPRLEVTYQNFEGNLEDMAAAARAGGGDVLFSTVGANLAHCAPFASQPGPQTTAADRTRLQELLEQGIAHQTANRPDEALAAYEAALRLDESHAELRFRTARCLEELGRAPEALEHYRAALEYDTLRFRADAGLNRVIRDVATAAAPPTAGSPPALVDATAALAAESEDATPGAKLFDDHVHLTPRGNYVVAREMVAAILPRLPALPAGATEGPQLDLEAVRHRIGHTSIARTLALDLMSQRRLQPPFAGNFDEAEWEERIEAERGTLAAVSTPEALRTIVEAQVENARRHPEDWDLRHTVANLLILTGNADAALPDSERLTARFPFDWRSHRELGRVYSALGREEEALASLRRALALVPGLDTARKDLCDELIRQGRRRVESDPAAALAMFEEAARVGPESAEAHHALGAAYLRAGRAADAAPELGLAVTLAPSLAAAHKKHGDALLATSRPDEAIVAYGEALRINPRYFLAMVGLGDAHRAAGSIEAARRQYRQALDLKPGATEVRLRIADLEHGE